MLWDLYYVPSFFLSISSSWVNQPNTLPGSALKVCVVVVCVWVGGGWVLKVNLVISFGFGQAEQ